MLKTLIPNSHNLYPLYTGRDFWWSLTRKPNKFMKHETIEEQLPMDSDELQHLDECNSEWVESWKAAAEKPTELEVHVFTPVAKKKRLVRIQTRR